MLRFLDSDTDISALADDERTNAGTSFFAYVDDADLSEEARRGLATFGPAAVALSPRHLAIASEIELSHCLRSCSSVAIRV